jgi:(S)-mandelate dehydrogenase
MNIRDALNIEDLRKMARRKLPRIAFDYIEGGVEDERCPERNVAAFARRLLLPRYLVDVSSRDQTATLFDRSYASPFGIAPTGLAGLFRADADLLLARAAAESNIPFVISGAATASIEAITKTAPAHTWYQLYCARNPQITEDLIRRARDAELSTLVVTVDIPINAKRERNLRNGFGLPPRLKPSVVAEALMHPGWLIEYLRRGQPRFETWAPYAGATNVNRFFAEQMPATATWRDLEAFRRLWPRHLVLKGILHPDDAVRAVELGVDGIWVSNHGGRQLDQAPAALDMLPEINAAVGERAVLMVDGGVRRGSDIVTALCLGAQFVFVGRATLYGAAAAGLAGIRRAIEILKGEVDCVMAQIGCPSLAHLGTDCLVQERHLKATTSLL